MRTAASAAVIRGMGLAGRGIGNSARYISAPTGRRALAHNNDLTICGGDYEHTLGLGGEHEGLRVTYRPMPVREIFIGMLEERRFEICEFSLANYITLRGRGERWLQAVPVFP